MGVRQIREMVNTLAGRPGVHLAADRTSCPQTAATHLLDEGGPAQRPELLVHSSLQTTQLYNPHLIERLLEDIRQRIHSVTGLQ